MKQRIAEKQLGELSKKELDIFLVWLGETAIKENSSEYAGMPTIRTLIEFLGDDLADIKNLHHSKEYQVQISSVNFKGIDPTYWNRDELIDALWEAVKYKLRNS